MLLFQLKESNTTTTIVLSNKPLKIMHDWEIWLENKSCCIWETVWTELQWIGSYAWTTADRQLRLDNCGSPWSYSLDKQKKTGGTTFFPKINICFSLENSTTFYTNEYDPLILQPNFKMVCSPWLKSNHLSLRNSPGRHRRCALKLPLRPSSDHVPWPSWPPLVSWHSSAETGLFDDHVPCLVLELEVQANRLGECYWIGCYQ